MKYFKLIKRKKIVAVFEKYCQSDTLERIILMYQLELPLLHLFEPLLLNHRLLQLKS